MPPRRFASADTYQRRIAWYSVSGSAKARQLRNASQQAGLDAASVTDLETLVVPYRSGDLNLAARYAPHVAQLVDE
jgi:hypothetical protein